MLERKAHLAPKSPCHRFSKSVLPQVRTQHFTNITLKSKFVSAEKYSLLSLTATLFATHERRAPPPLVRACDTARITYANVQRLTSRLPGR